MKKASEKAITLIALVITIIILLILAGITIITLAGDNGILSKTNLAGEEVKKKEYEEVLKIIGNGLKPDKVINNWNRKKFLDEFEKKVHKEEKFTKSQINRKNDETIIIITKEGYGYRITENSIEHIGKQGEIDSSKLEESNIIFSYYPSLTDKQWSNQNVIVSIKISNELEDKYELQYSLDGINWTKYRK